MKDRGSDLVTLPDLSDCQCVYLLEFLQEIGTYSVGMAGILPLPWSEINAWRDCTGTELTGMELVQIHELSKVYVQQYNNSSDRNTPPPYIEIDKKIDREKVNDGIKKAFEGFMVGKKKRPPKRKPKPETDEV